MAPIETEDYRLTKWKGLDNWQCKHCPFSTVGGIREMVAHLATHGLPVKGQAPALDPISDEEE